MKKASYILLAMMLIIAVFVSCKAEVIDDSDFLVNVMFSSENNSKGLTWSRDFVPENYYWSYDATKADEGPRTGTAKKAKVGGDEGKGGLTHDVGPFSVGTWNFTLYGYRDAERTELVYEGHTQAFLAKGSSDSVKVRVSSKTEKTGTILISKDIRLTDGTDHDPYVPTHFSINNAKDSTVANDVKGNVLEGLTFSATQDMSYEVKSGSYVVTIEMRNKDDNSVVYSSTQIYINVYDYQTTRIGGSLDDVKVSTKFEAGDGTITGTSGVQAISAKGSTTLTMEKVTPINSGNTSVEFPEGSLGNATKATLEVVAYPTSAIPGKFGISGNNSPLAGIDLSVFVGGNEVTEFGSAVTVTTFVTKNLTSKKITSETAIADREGFNLFYNGSNAGDKQPTLVSYTPDSGELVFMTNHFSLYYVTSTSAVAVNETTGVSHTSLKAAVDAVKDNETAEIVLLKNVNDGCDIVVEAGNKTITIDFNDKTYNMSGLFDPNSGNKQVFIFGKGNRITLRKGTISSTFTYASILIQNYSDYLKLDGISLDCSKMGASLNMVTGLSCGYGKTEIGGETSIVMQFAKYKAVEVVWLPSTDYKRGVDVSFLDNYAGMISGIIWFGFGNDVQYDKTPYVHSLCIEGSGGNFGDAKFTIPRVGSSSSFKVNTKIKENLTFYGNVNHPISKDEKGEYWWLDEGVVHNTTTDAVYEELPRAMNDATNKFENELVLKKNCIIKYLIKQPCKKKLKLDLNGCSITPSEDFDDTDNKTHVYALLRVDNGTLTITNSGGEKGYIDSTINSSLKYGIKVINGGTLIVKNGATIKGKEASISKDDSSTVNNLI